MGMYVAFAYFEFRDKGDLVLPVVGLPARIHLLATPTLATALVVRARSCRPLLGLVVYWLVFRPLRQAPALARVVASLGLLLYLQEVVRLRFPVAGVSAVTSLPGAARGPVEIFGTGVSQNRLLLAGAVVVVAAVARASCSGARGSGWRAGPPPSNEKGAVLTGISPDRVGVVNWMVASMLAGFAVILIEPIAGLDPATTSLLVVPALAAALARRPLVVRDQRPLPGSASACCSRSSSATRCGPTPTGSPTGCRPPGCSRPCRWRWSWWPSPGAATPCRRAPRSPTHRLPPSPTPRHVAPVDWWCWSALAAVGLLTLRRDLSPGAHRQRWSSRCWRCRSSCITGYVGQISLAQLAIAGVAGFTAIEVGDERPALPAGGARRGTVAGRPWSACSSASRRPACGA